MVDNTTRMVGVFGKREMEAAAIRILDFYWDNPFHKINTNIFKDEIEYRGYRMLIDYGWVENDVAKRSFWLRVHGR